MKLRRSLNLSLLATALTGALTFACAAQEEDESAAQESEAKKKIKPDGGITTAMTRFELSNPAWTSKAAFGGRYYFNGAPIALGDKKEFDLRTGSAPMTAAFALLDARGQWAVSETLSIAIGTTEKRKPAGVWVHFAEPLTDRGTDWVLDGAMSGEAWFAKPGAHTIATRYELNPFGANVADGDLTEIVRPITHVNIKLDAYDPLYPGTAAEYTITEGRMVSLRKADGTPAYSDYIVAHSDRFPIEVQRSGVKFGTVPTVAGGTVPLVFNRLEIDDVEVTINGRTTTQKGTSTIYVGATASGTALYSVPTHTGVDLPNGTYTVVSTTATSFGNVTHTETVSFP
jgi:hypothetical protein